MKKCSMKLLLYSMLYFRRKRDTQILSILQTNFNIQLGFDRVIVENLSGSFM